MSCLGLVGVFRSQCAGSKSAGHLLDILPNTWRQDSASQVQPEAPVTGPGQVMPPLLSNPCPQYREAQSEDAEARPLYSRLAPARSPHLCPLGEKPRRRARPPALPARARSRCPRARVSIKFSRAGSAEAASLHGGGGGGGCGAGVLEAAAAGLLPGRPGLAALLGRLSDRLGRNPDRRRREVRGQRGCRRARSPRPGPQAPWRGGETSVSPRGPPAPLCRQPSWGTGALRARSAGPAWS